MVTFLLSARTSWVTGANVVVDGGQRYPSAAGSAPRPCRARVAAGHGPGQDPQGGLALGQDREDPGLLPVGSADDQS